MMIIKPGTYYETVDGNRVFIFRTNLRHSLRPILGIIERKHSYFPDTYEEPITYELNGQAFGYRKSGDDLLKEIPDVSVPFDPCIWPLCECVQHGSDKVCLRGDQ